MYNNEPPHDLTPEEILSRPDVVLGLLGSVLVVLGAAIRLTRMSSDASVTSFQTYVEPVEENSVEKWRWIKAANYKEVSRRWIVFWGKIPRRVWNFYVEAFLVPGYRKEWGKYTIWSYRSRTRPLKSKELRKELIIQKRILRQTCQLDDKNPRPIPHSHADCERIVINVGGMKYETQLRTLQRFPDTLLGNPNTRVKYYNPSTRQYYFDRNRKAFEAILYFYQSGGRFRRPDNINADVLLEDAQFYQLSENVIEQFKVEEGMTPQSSRHEMMPGNLLLRKIWLLFDSPESSSQGKIVALTSILALFISIGLFCIETLDVLKLKPVFAINPAGYTFVLRFYETDLADPFFLTETACNAWFIFEFLARFASSPFKGVFIKSLLNVIDLVAILPFIITICSPSQGVLEDDEEPNTLNAADTLYLLRIVRLVRVFRIFKLSKHSKGLKILGKTLRASLNELILLIFFVFIGVILFSSTMYFAELEDPGTHFDSIPGGFWWALITITTVGFGDDVPRTPLGKVVGTLCAVAGVLTIALPVPVIVSNFNFFYHQAIDEHALRWISINHVASCPNRPAGYDEKNRDDDEDDT